jgi:hypothetical protein
MADPFEHLTRINRAELRAIEEATRYTRWIPPETLKALQRGSEYSSIADTVKQFSNFHFEEARRLAELHGSTAASREVMASFQSSNDFVKDLVADVARQANFGVSTLFEEAARSAREYVQSELEKLSVKSAFGSSFHDLAREVSSSTIENVNSFALAAAKPFSESLVRSLEPLSNIPGRDLFEATLSQLGGMRGSAMLASFASFEDTYRDLFEHTTVGDLSRLLRGLAESGPDTAEQETAIDEFVEDWITRLPANRVTATGARQVLMEILTVLSILLSLYQIHQANLAADRESRNKSDFGNPTAVSESQFHTLVRSIERIGWRLDQLTLERDKYSYYLVERPVQVKVSPRFNAATITTLDADQPVRLVAKKHQWILIEYFDHIEGWPRAGWVSKKYLKILTRKPPRDRTEDERDIDLAKAGLAQVERGQVISGEELDELFSRLERK